jgi:hypothetical protein
METCLSKKKSKRLTGMMRMRRRTKERQQQREPPTAFFRRIFHVAFLLSDDPWHRERATRNLLIQPCFPCCRHRRRSQVGQFCVGESFFRKFLPTKSILRGLGTLAMNGSNITVLCRTQFRNPTALVRQLLST